LRNIQERNGDFIDLLCNLNLTLTATGIVTYQSSESLLAESVLVDQEGNQLARGSGSFIKSKIGLTPVIGYL